MQETSIASEPIRHTVKPTPSILIAAAVSLVWFAAFARVSVGQVAAGGAGDKPAKGYAEFAMKNEGDAMRGKSLFETTQRVACTLCHSLDGRGSKAGPDLATVGDQFSRRDLIDAVLAPSATIAVGYGMTTARTRAGETFAGVLKDATDSWIELMGIEGKRTRIAVSDIVERSTSSVSLMPEGLCAALSPQEFADLIEYLVSLKEPAHTSEESRGMPEAIPALATAAELHPFLPVEISEPKEKGKARTGLVWFGQIPGMPRRFLAIHQAGKMWLVEKRPEGDAQSLFADLSGEVYCASGPNGLLGLAFHPRFRENRKYYLKHQVFEEGTIATVLEEREFAADFQKDSGQPPRRLLKIVSGAEHHNGGCIEFGPDGFLYLGMGDSAPNFDPQGFAQDLRLLYGKMLRLDVDRRDPGLAYAIPRDNPFVNRRDARPEIWALGLREPWRFSFDPVTGDLWAADLGQERGDEVDLVRRGENYGWNAFEGFELFSKAHHREGAAYAPPIFAGRRRHGTTMIGGRVYRGDPRSSFYGVYVFGDFQSKRIWGLTQEHGSLKTIRQIATAPQSIAAFAADEAGQLYAVGYEGMIYRLDLAGARFDGPVAATDAPPGAVSPAIPGAPSNSRSP